MHWPAGKYKKKRFARWIPSLGHSGFVAVRFTGFFVGVMFKVFTAKEYSIIFLIFNVFFVLSGQFL
jgi:hypothetical protein